MKIVFFFYNILLISLFSSMTSSSQMINKYLYRYRNGLCSSVIFLNSDSLYLTESGCEKSSYISFGYYKLKNDSILFNPIDLNKHELIKEISYRQNNSDTIKIHFLETTGKNISSRMKVYQELDNGKKFTMKMDSSNNYVFDIRRGTKPLRVRNIENLFGQRIEIEPNKGQEVKIVLNYPVFWMTFPSNKWHNIISSEVVYKLTSDKILTNLELNEENRNQKEMYLEFRKITD